MVLIELSEVIRAPPEMVFSVMSDFEKASEYSQYWKSVKLLNRFGNTATYETVAEAEGRTLKSQTRVTYYMNERMESETVDGDGKGTKLTFTFKKVPDGTQLALDGDIVLPGFARMLGGIVKERITSGMREELNVIKRHIEKTSTGSTL
jgi:uncharacterized membrane protein